MKLEVLTPRSDWKAKVETLGFDWHSIYDAPYWEESKYYSLSLNEIENELEDPTQELLEMTYKAVEEVLTGRYGDFEETLNRLQIPVAYHEYVANSWFNGEADLYGRMDLSYGTGGPAKLLEFNADTPTSLYESSVIQWQWLEDLQAQGTLRETDDQFNSIHENLVYAFQHLDLPEHMHFACFTEQIEDYGTLAYLADVAAQVGKKATIIDVQEIGIDAEKYFTDLNDQRINTIFKLYPWEDMFREEFGPMLTANKTRFIEPAWKSIVSNKGFLAILWDMFPNHKNLLPAFFANDPRADKLENFALKPLFSREGANVTLSQGGKVLDSASGEYGAEGFVKQELALLPKFGDYYTVVGSWVVAGRASGICFREDGSLITKDSSLFIPHIIR